MTALATKMPYWVSVAAFAFLVGVGAVLGWNRHARQLRTTPPASADLDFFKLMPNRISGTPPQSYLAAGQSYESDAYNLAAGKRLYKWFGCQACHGDGSGGVGPSFLDGWWLYGPEMVSIVSSIRDGRPHGMPSFREKLTTEQIWQLAGYVQTIGAYSSKAAAPGRDDAKQTRPAENRGPAAILFQEGPAQVHSEQGPSP